MLVVDGVVGERSAGSLAMDDVEEVGHGSSLNATLPTANEFTYMIRSASCQPQYVNASLPCTPKRASTSGVIELERVLRLRRCPSRRSA